MLTSQVVSTPPHPALNALLEAPRTITALQVDADVLNREQRKTIWDSYGVESSLEALATLLAAIDFSNLDDTRHIVEQFWLNGINDRLANRVHAVIGQTQFIFSARALVQCAREVI